MMMASVFQRRIGASVAQAFDYRFFSMATANSHDFDLVVIGAGSGGMATARRAAQHGAKVLVRETAQETTDIFATERCMFQHTYAPELITRRHKQYDQVWIYLF